MKNLKNKILLLILTSSILTSCIEPIFSPGISITNASNDCIYNVDINWNGYRLNGGGNHRPGLGGTEIFILRKKSHLYGPVKISWFNAKKEKIIKEFIFKKSDLPVFRKGRRGGVKLYLMQNKLVMFVKIDTSQYSKKEMIILKKTGHYQRQYKKNKLQKKSSLSCGHLKDL